MQRLTDQNYIPLAPTNIMMENIDISPNSLSRFNELTPDKEQLFQARLQSDKLEVLYHDDHSILRICGLHPRHCNLEDVFILS